VSHGRRAGPAVCKAPRRDMRSDGGGTSVLCVCCTWCCQRPPAFPNARSRPCHQLAPPACARRCPWAGDASRESWGRGVSHAQVQSGRRVHHPQAWGCATRGRYCVLITRYGTSAQCAHPFFFCYSIILKKFNFCIINLKSYVLLFPQTCNTHICFSSNTFS